MKEKYTFIDKLMIALIVLFSFYCLEPFFVWETFAGGVFRTFLGIVPFRTLFGIAIIILGVCCYYKKGKDLSKLALCGLTLIVAIFTVVFAGGTDRSQVLSLAWIPYIVVITYLLLPRRIQRRSYEIFALLFAVTLIMPIIYYGLTHLGISVPYMRLESMEEYKVISGKFYKLYPLASQITSIWDPKWQELRMSGIFDESGRVGTLAGLILATEKFKLKGNLKNIVILIGGICSFSLAFYAIAVIYHLVVSFGKKQYRSIVVVAGVVVAYFAFVNVQFSNPNIIQFQQRLEFSSEGLSGDNRTNEKFDELMDEFYHSDAYSLIFGKGDGAIGEIQAERNIDGSSYKCMIYNFGFVGYGLSIVWLFLCALYYIKKNGANKAHIIAILAVYLANMYQRPSVFYMGYLLIFFGGMVIASREKIDDRSIVEQKKRRRGFLRVKCRNTISYI